MNPTISQPQMQGQQPQNNPKKEATVEEMLVRFLQQLSARLDVVEQKLGIAPGQVPEQATDQPSEQGAQPITPNQF